MAGPRANGRRAPCAAVTAAIEAWRLRAGRIVAAASALPRRRGAALLLALLLFAPPALSQSPLPPGPLGGTPRAGEVKTAQTGGNGAGVYLKLGDLRCPADRPAIVGVRTRHGTVLDFIQVGCASLACDGKSCRWDDVSWGASAGNPSGGRAPEEQLCDENEVVGGYDATVRHLNVGVDFDYAAAFRIRCASAYAVTRATPRPRIDTYGYKANSRSCNGVGASSVSYAVGRWGFSGSPVVQAVLMLCPDKPARAPNDVAACRHPSELVRGTRVQLNTARDVYKLISSLYRTGRPIEVARVANLQNTWMVALAGTESGVKQANSVTLSRALEDFHNDYRSRNPAGLLTIGIEEILQQPKLREFALTTVEPDFRSSQGKTTMFQVRILQALRTHGVPAGAQLIIAGHSLGGMDAQNVARSTQLRNYGYRPINVMTFGSPITIDDDPTIGYSRFASRADPVPYAAMKSLQSDRRRWNYVRNPGDDPRLPLIGDVNAWKNLADLFVKTVQAAHLNYDQSNDLDDYDPRTGRRGPGEPLVLDANDARCYTAADDYYK
ncbi:MAG TPA: hypothetical protein PKA20_18795 [Burkholderiaceae bacterium]|nr:hypothetical protein [Burkholderiaceae bacterium]